MDEFEKRLKRDAAALDAEVSAELKARIDASLRGVEPIRPATPASSSSVGLWWASSLTGLAAAVAVIVLLNWNRQEPLPPPADMSVHTVPADTETPLTKPFLDVRTADFASPLEEELLKFKADIEKARESVRQDLDSTF